MIITDEKLKSFLFSKGRQHFTECVTETRQGTKIVNRCSVGLWVGINQLHLFLLFL